MDLFKEMNGVFEKFSVESRDLFDAAIRKAAEKTLSAGRHAQICLAIAARAGRLPANVFHQTSSSFSSVKSGLIILLYVSNSTAKLLL